MHFNGFEQVAKTQTSKARSRSRLFPQTTIDSQFCSVKFLKLFLAVRLKFLG